MRQLTEQDGNSSKNGADGEADGCLASLPSSAASAGEDSKTAATGTSKLNNSNGGSNNG